MYMYIYKLGLHYAVCYIEPQQNRNMATLHFVEKTPNDAYIIAETIYFDIPKNIDIDNEKDICHLFSGYILSMYIDKRPPFDKWRDTYGLPQKLVINQSIDNQININDLPNYLQ